jgi:nitrite reductase/ring-hydroxylating ferredoxin subunit
MRTTLAALFTLSIAVSTVAADAPSKIDYRFDEVRRTVTVVSNAKESAAAKGSKAHSGDTVRTGWFSYALIASETHRAKFELFSGTDVQLASTEPGVILSLNRGKLHAMFDKITGSEPRVVKTPGALLAVRGTQYTVEVDKSGNTTLDVSEGTVEIRSPLHPAPMLVHAGEAANFGRQQPPTVHPRGEGPQGGRDGHGGQNPPNGAPGGHHPPGGGTSTPGGQPPPSGHPPGGSMPPPPPPGRP